MWRRVPGHPAYEVSDDGRARRGSREVGKKLTHGYRRIWMDGKEYALHRVILETFVGPPPLPESVGRHLNDNRSDNRIGNLAWGTQQENVDDMLRNSGHWASHTDTCKRGHPLAPNPYTSGRRYCPTCKSSWRHRTGRSVKGHNPKRKLSDAQVLALRREYVPGKRGEYARLGRKYSISGVQARNIALGVQRGVSAPYASDRD